MRPGFATTSPIMRTFIVKNWLLKIRKPRTLDR